MTISALNKSYIRLKSTVEFIVAILVFLLLLPFFILAALSIKLESKGPVFYSQQRVGLNEKLFDVLKFRTMTVDDDRHESQTLPGSSDVTRVGHVLRRTKIDELPQLLNVIKGDMSLVGPRPCLPSLLDDIDEIYRQRFLVKPGLTGLAQVNGNIYIEWEDRFKYDITYVQNISLIQDLRILIKTVAVIGFGEKKFVDQSRK